MMLKDKPVGHRIIIKMDKLEDVSSGGIVLVRNEREQGAAVRGTVLAVGADCWYDKPSKWADVGDKVIIAKYAGFELEPLIRVINDEDILAVVTE